jgi:hypothetical protein
MFIADLLNTKCEQKFRQPIKLSLIISFLGPMSARTDLHLDSCDSAINLGPRGSCERIAMGVLDLCARDDLGSRHQIDWLSPSQCTLSHVMLNTRSFDSRRHICFTLLERLCRQVIKCQDARFTLPVIDAELCIKTRPVLDETVLRQLVSSSDLTFSVARDYWW